MNKNSVITHHSLSLGILGLRIPTQRTQKPEVVTEAGGGVVFPITTWTVYRKTTHELGLDTKLFISRDYHRVFLVLCMFYL